MDVETTREILKAQLLETVGARQPVTCPCGLRVEIRAAYRCRECAVWFCAACALDHFGLEIGELGRVVRISR